MGRPARNRTRSSTRYWAIHIEPNEARLVSAAMPARPPAPTPAWAAHRVAQLTASVDTPSDRNDRAQKGATSPATERRPPLPHTHLRFNSKDGTVPTAVATTLAQPAVAAPVPIRTTSTVRPTVVEMADTPA